MNRLKKLHLLPLALTLACTAIAEASDNLQAFPAAEQGMVRHVLELPQKENESTLKVELIVGKTQLLDPQNNYFYTGAIEAKTVQGWGFTSYEVRSLGSMAGTMMAIDPSQEKVARFIAVSGSPYLVRYNSRLPIVIYLPEDAEVKYRIWSATPDFKIIEKG